MNPGVKRGGPVAAALVMIGAGCATVDVPPHGWRTCLEVELMEAKTPSCFRAVSEAEHLQYHRAALPPEAITNVVMLIQDRRLCEDARLELVRVLALSGARDQLSAMRDCLEVVDPAESRLADELAAVIIDFTDTYDEAFQFIRQHVDSEHVTVRYGCVELLLQFFKPGRRPQYANEVVDMLIERIAGEEDAAVAEIACRALGEMGMGADTNRREEIRRLLEDVSNDIGRRYPNPGRRGEVPSGTAEDVRRTAVKYSVDLAGR